MFDSTDSTTADRSMFGLCDVGSRYDHSASEYGREEFDLWLIESRREWREYLRVLWLDVLRAGQYLGIIRFSNCRLYYRRLLFSVSGYLNKKGRAKKN